VAKDYRSVYMEMLDNEQGRVTEGVKAPIKFNDCRRDADSLTAAGGDSYETTYAEMIKDSPEERRLREVQQLMRKSTRTVESETIYLVVDWESRRIRSATRDLAEAKKNRSQLDGSSIAIFEIELT